ncbi:hypothetical protein BKE30_08120 [Alkanindiges hydrocarboniclasticus]|uniref:Gp5/Type VI secretion system Vgr protein OB-fold domain-containing protein n=1 Tax=Alkanindiges hydrocarboniclasticus TaxID=1907941 RepID=A0A1S8CUU7_9GAMM|nr:hypothetical protein [Alkanindiges hydrocarboniclasticus]ONG39754.1 hypothetical protein BKE30_08120 [Alkanindiges hydrocarboniclasticus]
MFGFPRAKILSYNQKARTAQIHIYGMTDGASEGLEATFAYPVGDDDLDTEREILVGADVYIFFQNGDEGLPVVWSYSSHGEGAVEDVRRIRQKNIEILARANVLVQAGQEVTITGASKVNIVSAGGVDVQSETKVSLRAPVISLNGP